MGKKRCHGQTALVGGTLLVTLAGCAASPEEFRKDRDSMSVVTLCRTYQKTMARGDSALGSEVATELRERGTSPSGCAEIVRQQNQKIAAALVAVAAVAAVAASASNSGGGTANSYATDYQWDWDIFYNQYGQLVAYCRGVQTGQFAEAWRCNGKAQTDSRWPGK